MESTNNPTQTQQPPPHTRTAAVAVYIIMQLACVAVAIFGLIISMFVGGGIGENGSSAILVALLIVCFGGAVLCITVGPWLIRWIAHQSSFRSDAEWAQYGRTLKYVALAINVLVLIGIVAAVPMFIVL